MTNMFKKTVTACSIQAYTAVTKGMCIDYMQYSYTKVVSKFTEIAQLAKSGFLHDYKYSLIDLSQACCFNYCDFTIIRKCCRTTLDEIQFQYFC